jgi:cellulose synthase operon protein C
MKRYTAAWLLAAGLGLSPLAPALADTPQTVAVRVGNHDGYGRVVFHLPPRTGYSVAQDGQHVVVKFTADLAVGVAAAIPRNVVGITGGTNQAELTFAPGALLHDWRLGDLVVIDVLDAGAGGAPAALASTPKAPPPAEAAATGRPPSAQPAVPPPPPPPKPEPTSAQPEPTAPAPPPSAPPATPPAASPAAQSPAPPPAPPAEPPPSATPATAAAEQVPEADDALVVSSDAQLGIAAFRRGDSALIVFEERRAIDTTPLRDAPVFGTATVQLLPTATVVRVRIEPATILSLSRTEDAWRVSAVTREAPLRPIRATAAEDRLVLSATAPGSVVSLADPDTGATLLVGTGAWRAALALLRDTEALFPDDKAAVHAELTNMFAALLRDDTANALPPLELVSVVEENADLLPTGADGEALQAKLADRLLALDLPKRAGSVLEKLMQAANSDAARAGFGARLAALRLRESDPAGALAALDASVATDLPADLAERRTLLVAAANARRGDNERALAALASLDTPAADEARATILDTRARQ